MSTQNECADDVRRQVATLCDNLQARADTLHAEESMLAGLVSATERTRPFRSRQYQSLLTATQERYRRLRAVIRRYCW